MGRQGPEILHPLVGGVGLWGSPGVNEMVPHNGGDASRH
jgi:hypothetical protein